MGLQWDLYQCKLLSKRNVTIGVFHFPCVCVRERERQDTGVSLEPGCRWCLCCCTPGCYWAARPDRRSRHRSSSRPTMRFHVILMRGIQLVVHSFIYTGRKSRHRCLLFTVFAHNTLEYCCWGQHSDMFFSLLPYMTMRHSLSFFVWQNIYDWNIHWIDYKIMNLIINQTFSGFRIVF